MVEGDEIYDYRAVAPIVVVHVLHSPWSPKWRGAPEGMFWSYRADPPPEATIRGEEDYDVLVAKTSNMVGAANTEIIKVNRP
jgi:hypothetical protein